MSGASAGGLNAVLAASAMIGRRPVGEMRGTWLRVAGLRELLESDIGADRDRRSLLGGEYFAEQVLSEVRRLMVPPPTPAWPALDHRLEVFLSATVHHGLHVKIEDDDYSPDAARRSGALFHFRHLAPTPPTSDLAGTLDSGVDTRLAHAARTTASFPTAFEPMRFDPDELPGVLLLPAAATGPVWLLDGGIVDNIPVARAIEGVPEVPAIDTTDRWLIYLQPSPDRADPGRRRSARQPVAARRRRRAVRRVHVGDDPRRRGGAAPAQPRRHRVGQGLAGGRRRRSRPCSLTDHARPARRSPSTPPASTRCCSTRCTSSSGDRSARRWTRHRSAQPPHRSWPNCASSWPR